MRLVCTAESVTIAEAFTAFDGIGASTVAAAVLATESADLLAVTVYWTRDAVFPIASFAKAVPTGSCRGLPRNAVIRT